MRPLLPLATRLHARARARPLTHELANEHDRQNAARSRKQIFPLPLLARPAKMASGARVYTLPNYNVARSNRRRCGRERFTPRVAAPSGARRS